jgi:hypothetical protein
MHILVKTSSNSKHRILGVDYRKFCAMTFATIAKEDPTPEPEPELNVGEVLDKFRGCAMRSAAEGRPFAALASLFDPNGLGR